MKLRELQRGDTFRYAAHQDGSVYVKGGAIPGTMDERFYVHSTTIGYIYWGFGSDEVVRIGNINED